MFNLKKILLHATEYKSGYVNDEDKYVISASMVAKEPLQNYLSIIHGKVHELEINDATLGSIFHKGMEQIVRDHWEYNDEKKNIIGIERSLYKELTNGWILSGTADLMINNGNGKFTIRDYKLSKTYALKMIKKNISTHDYTKQLQVLEALFRNNDNDKSYDVIEGDIELIVDFFAKDAKAIEMEPTYTPLTVPNKRGTEDMNATEVTFAEIIQITDSLQGYLESGTIPSACKDVWWRNVKGKNIPTRCALYCSHKDICPHYDNSKRDQINRLSNW